MNSKISRLLLKISLCVLISAQASALPTYNIQGLGFLGGSFQFSNATAINNLGQVAGTSTSSNGFNEGFFWDPNTGMEGIGRLPNSESSSAFGINDGGEIVGFSPQPLLPGPPGQGDHFIWDRANGIRSLGATHPTEAFSIANDINNSSQVAGTALYPHPSDPNIFLNGTPSTWDPVNGNRNLGTLSPNIVDGGGNASGINEAGFIVGEVFDATRSTSGLRGVVEAFIWDENNGLVALNPLNPDHQISGALEVNNQNDVVGFSEQDFDSIRAVVWENGGGDPTALGLIDQTDGPSFARAINDEGLIVGDIINSTLFPQFGPNPFATIWEDNIAHYLGNLLVNPDGWLGLLSALDINEAGQIVGQGVRPGGPFGFTFEAFILTPVTTAAIPEPGVMLLFLSGMLLLVSGNFRAFKRGRSQGHCAI